MVDSPTAAAHRDLDDAIASARAEFIALCREFAAQEAASTVSANESPIRSQQRISLHEEQSMSRAIDEDYHRNDQLNLDRINESIALMRELLAENER